LIIGKIDDTANEVSDSTIEGYPTVMFYPKGEKKPLVFEKELSLKNYKKFLQKNVKSLQKHDEL
jgi:hypothetical protein